MSNDTLRKTCAHCPNLKIDQLPMMGRIASCKATGAVVPQASERDDARGEWKFVFWRVPVDCPLSDDEVLKSAGKAPQKDWVTITEPLSLERPVLSPTRAGRPR